MATENHKPDCVCVDCDRQRAAFATAANFGKVYGYLDGIRELAKHAVECSGRILEQRELDELERLVALANRCVGIVMDASRRSAHASR